MILKYFDTLQTAPEIPTYLYLFAPISLVILNPIGLILMEIGKVKSQTNERIGEQEAGIEERLDNSRTRQPNVIQRMFNVKNRNCRTCIKIIKGVVTNPLIFMTVFGVFCGTYVFPGESKNLSNLIC